MTWDTLRSFGIIREASADDDEKEDPKKAERGETADQRRARELAAARAAGNPLTSPSKPGQGGGENRPVGISSIPGTKSPTPLGTGRGIARRVNPGASTLKKAGQTQASRWDRDAPDDAAPPQRRTTPLQKPNYKGSFIGQIWQPTGQTQKWTNRYFDFGAGSQKRASGERMARREEALFWDGTDWVPQAQFVMGKRGEAPPTQPVKGQQQGMTPLPPSREEAEKEARDEAMRIMKRPGGDREQARLAAKAVYDRYDQKYAEYSRTTGKPARKIERPDWISGDRPRQPPGGAGGQLSGKLGGSKEPKEYQSWDDVPPEQRKEIEKYLASQEPEKKPVPAAATAQRMPSFDPPGKPAASSSTERRPAPSPMPADAPWRSLQKAFGGQEKPGEKESDAQVLARMRARAGMPPKKEGVSAFAVLESMLNEFEVADRSEDWEPFSSFSRMFNKEQLAAIKKHLADPESTEWRLGFGAGWFRGRGPSDGDMDMTPNGTVFFKKLDWKSKDGHSLYADDPNANTPTWMSPKKESTGAFAVLESMLGELQGD